MKGKVTVSVWNDFWGKQLCEGLIRGGWTVVYHHTGGKKASGAIDRRNWPAALLNRLGFKGWLPQKCAFRFSRRLVDKQGGRLACRSSMFWGWSGCSLGGIEAARRRGIPAVIECGSTHEVHNRQVVSGEYRRHGLAVDDGDDAYLRYQLREYAGADYICVPSKVVKKTFLDHGVPERKVILNPYGVDYGYWSNLEPARSPDVFRFLWVAALVPRKGLFHLLEAWRQADLRDAELVMVGGLAPSVQERLGDWPRGVRHVGHTSADGVKEWVARSDVYLLPSLEEGMARSVLEAMAAGLPVIVTEETGATDVLGAQEGGWVVPAGDAGALRACLEAVAGNRQEAERRGRLARQCVRPFTWDAYGDRAARMADDVMRGSHPAG